MTMAITFTFSRENDVASHARATQYWENIFLVVVLVLESEDLYQNGEWKSEKKKEKKKKKKKKNGNRS